jgi:hypothetical protein
MPHSTKAPVAIGLTLLAGSAAFADITLTPIALSGQSAPGLPGATFARLAQPRINADGALAFWARLEGQGITAANDGTIWSDRSGVLALSFREGDAAPFDADIRWGAFPFPAFNDSTDLSFTAALFDAGGPPAPTNLGIFAEHGEGPLVVAREGFSAPGLPNGGVFDGLPVAPFGDTGEVVFNGSKGAGAWTWDGADPVPVAVTGTPAPGLGPPWQFAFIDNPAKGASGVLAFRASVIDPAKPKDPRPSLWLASGGVPTLIAWADPAHQGRYFTDFGIEPVVSASGDVRFWASMAGEGVDPSNDTAILSSGDNPPDQLVAEGSAAPGGGLFGQLPRQFASDPAGDIAFVAPLVGPDVDTGSNSGVYVLSEAGTLSLVAREGAQAPGLADGVLYAVLGRPVLSAAGAIAFDAQLRGGAGPGDNFALFVAAPGAAPGPVVRTGDIIDAGGAPRTVREVSFASGDAGTGYSQFSPDGALVLHLTFTDGSQGLFAASAGGDCYPDIDGNGSLDLFDFLAFVNFFNAGDETANCDHQGGLDLFDFLCFVNAYNAGC